MFLSEPCEDPGERLIAVLPRLQSTSIPDNLTVRRLHIKKNGNVDTDEVDYSLATMPACIQQTPEGLGMGPSLEVLMEAVVS